MYKFFKAASMPVQVKLFMSEEELHDIDKDFIEMQDVCSFTSVSVNSVAADKRPIKDAGDNELAADMICEKRVESKKPTL